MSGDAGTVGAEPTHQEHPVTAAIDVRRADDRPHTRFSWLDSRHCFSFGHHYDPDNTHHGLLLVSNDDRVAGGGGFSAHGHRDMEIVTWVLSGRLLHEDSTGQRGEIYPGLAQRMSAGSGIVHSEMNASPSEEVHFVQMWVPPDTTAIEPGYEQRDVSEALDGGGLVPVASGQGHDGAVVLRQRDAVLWAGRLGPGEQVAVPGAPHVHLFVAIGSGVLAGAEPLAQGDAVRFTDVHDATFTAGDSGAEVLAWATA
jgi:quercetin 2,3-dioxygenase